MQQCWPTTRSTVGPNMLRPFAWNHNVVADVRVLAAQAPYTEGTPQRLDSDVHSVVTAKKSTAL